MRERVLSRRRFAPHTSTGREQTIKPLFATGPSLTARLIVFVLASVALMTMDHRFGLLKDVRAALSLVIYPVQSVVNFPASLGEWMGETFATRERLAAELTSLRTQQLLINARLQKLAALEAENERLRQMLDSSFLAGERVLVAEIMSVDMAPYSRKLVINKGSRHGVFEGQPVLDAKGVIGQVVHVGPVTSQVMLISDPNHAIPVAVARNGLRATAFGTGASDMLDVPHFPTHADIRKGDLLVSSGLGGRFPRGYPVAVITQIHIDPGQAFARVVARPTGGLQSGSQVMLAWPAQLTEDAAPATAPAPAHTAPERQTRDAGVTTPAPATPATQPEARR